MDTKKNDGVELLEFCMGAESPLNLVGKVLLFPIIVSMAIIWGILDLLFTAGR